MPTINLTSLANYGVGIFATAIIAILAVILTKFFISVLKEIRDIKNDRNSEVATAIKGMQVVIAENTKASNGLQQFLREQNAENKEISKQHVEEQSKMFDYLRDHENKCQACRYRNGIQ